MMGPMAWLGRLTASTSSGTSRIIDAKHRVARIDGDANPARGSCFQSVGVQWGKQESRNLFEVTPVPREKGSGMSQADSRDKVVRHSD